MLMLKNTPQLNHRRHDWFDSKIGVFLRFIR